MDQQTVLLLTRLAVMAAELGAETIALVERRRAAAEGQTISWSEVDQQIDRARESSEKLHAALDRLRQRAQSGT